MVTWRPLTYIALLLVFCFSSSVSVQSQSSLGMEELWQYGRGVIYDFEWNEQHLVFPAGGRIWQVDPLSNQPPAEKEKELFHLSTSSDGTHFITYDAGNFLLWSAQTNTVVTTIRPGGYAESDAVAWHPEGNLLATVGHDTDTSPEYPYRVELWNTSTGDRTATLGSYAELVVALSWHPDGAMLAVRQSNGTITIENVISGEQIQELTVNAGNSATVAWSPDGSMLAATSGSQSPVNLWQTDTFEPITATHQPTFVVTLAWNADSVRLAGALPGSGVGIWNVETGELTSLGVEASDSIDRVVEHIAWHGDQLAALDRTRRLHVWDVGENALVWDSTKHQFHSEVWAMAVSRDGALVAVGYDYTKEIPILDGATGTLRQTLRSPRLLYRLSDMEWSPSGEQLAVGTGILFIWSLGQDASADPIQVDNLGKFSWSPNGTLAVASQAWREEELRFMDSKTGEPLPEMRELPGLMSPHWSPDGHYIALYRYNPPGEDDAIPPYQIDIWDMQQHAIATTIRFPHSDDHRRHPSPFFLWLPDSSGLIGFTQGGALWRWQLDAREAKILVPEPPFDTTNQLFPLSINACGDLLAVSNPMTNGQVHILDVDSGGLLFALDDLAAGSNFFAWGGDDRLFVYDGVLHAYRITRSDP